MSSVSFRREFSFDNVSFIYPEADSITLSPISFELPCGRTTAIVGPSGAGKTTIVNLMLKLLEPSTGSIIVDGINLNRISRVSWLQQIAVSGQDMELIDGSIIDNVRLARPEASEADVAEALATVGIEEFVHTLPQKCHTQIGERGLRISGGQRQRIALARALICRPQILVLDEATNALGVESQEHIFARIREWSSDVTIILIDHRPEMLDSADHVVVLGNGE